jgi:hypothetical protein
MTFHNPENPEEQAIRLQEQKPSGIFSGPKGPKNQFSTAADKVAA